MCMPPQWFLVARALTTPNQCPPRRAEMPGKSTAKKRGNPVTSLDASSVFLALGQPSIANAVDWLQQLLVRARVITQSEGADPQALDAAARVEKLAALALQEVHRGDAEAAAWASLAAMDAAWLVDTQQSTVPRLVRDNARQDGTRKERRPDLQSWIDDEVKKGTGESAGQLWTRAPEWVTDQIGFDRFTKRVTQGRKKAEPSRK